MEFGIRILRLLLVSTLWVTARCRAGGKRVPRGSNQSRSKVLGPYEVAVWRGTELQPKVPSSWSRLQGPVGTVCVTGDDRVGKSTLLTLWGRKLLQGEEFSFSTGHNRTSHTQGIWSAILDAQATSLDYHINLCDSQGLKQVSEQKQWRLFEANVLLPSVIVYMLINVVQNDQLRDLARMAYKFQKLSSDTLGLFHRHLSADLIVLVREESDLDDRSLGANRWNLTGHLEEALASPGFEEDKELIKQVFARREAWALAELPAEARQGLRHGDPVKAGGAQGDAWRESSENVLRRVLSALQRRRALLPQNGLEVSQWYKNVLQTVNSGDEQVLGRLVGHSEQLVLRRKRQDLLSRWRWPCLAVLAGLALLAACRDWVQRMLDKVAWLVWVAMCVCYVGTSPLVTAPLSGFIPRYCEGLTGGIVHAVCREASAHTAAVLVAIILGTISYPMLTGRLQRLLRKLPVPEVLQRSCTTLALVSGMLLGLLLQEANLILLASDSGDWSAWALPVAVVLLSVAAGCAAVQVAFVAQHNSYCLRVSESGRALHSYMTERFEEVRALEVSAEWHQYYRHHAQSDALWRLRAVPVNLHVMRCGQALGLLAWALLIQPHFDFVLAVGVSLNTAYLVWGVLATFCWRNPQEGLVKDWIDGLEDEPNDLAADGVDSDDMQKSRPCPILPETEEEVRLRQRIEEINVEQAALAEGRCRSHQATATRRVRGAFL